MLGAMDLQWLGWVGVALGVVLVAWGLVGVRPRAGHCRRCGHPVPPGAGARGGACAECGGRFERAADMVHRQRGGIKASIGLIVILGGTTFGIGHRGRSRVAQVLTPAYQVTNTQTWGDVIVTISEPRWPELEPERQELVEVLIHGSLAWRTELENPTAGALSGDRFWVREQTSGSGGYSTTFVFDTGLRELRPLLVLHEGTFEDSLEGPIWNQADLSYRYWVTSGADSPVPYLRGRLRADTVVFEKPSPDAAPKQTHLDALAESIRRSEPTSTASGTILSASLRGFLELLYAGEAPRAWQFLERCHDAGLERLLSSGSVSDLPRSREAFKTVLLEKVSQSPHYAEVLRINGGSIRPPER